MAQWRILEMSLMHTSTRTGLDMARAKHALAAAGVDPALALTRVSSVTNEVWLSDDFAVRVSRRPDKRLWREARLAPYLPAAARYPEVVGYGTGTGFDWLVTRRNRGNVLSRCWPTMSDAQQRLAVGQISSILRALHATRMPIRLGDVKDLGAPLLLKFGRHVDPIAPLLDGLARAAELPFVDPDVMYDLAALVVTSSWTLEPFPERTLIHGDLTFENVLWDGNEVTGIIDFEWARAAPRDSRARCAAAVLRVPLHARRGRLRGADEVRGLRSRAVMARARTTPSSSALPTCATACGSTPSRSRSASF